MSVFSKKGNDKIPPKPYGDLPAGFCAEIVQSLFLSKPTHDIETVNDELVAQIEQELGYPLPQSYVDLMRYQNGGSLRCCLFYHDGDEFLLSDIFPISFVADNGLCGEFSNQFWQDPDNWAYPDVGVYFADEDGGHGLFAFDYRDGVTPDPKIINVYNDGEIAIEVVAENFIEFIHRLKTDEIDSIDGDDE